MKIQLFSVYDTKMEIYAPPFIAHNDATGIRHFGDMARSEHYPYRQHPKDYVLFNIGTWDDHTGMVEGCPPKNLGQLPNEELEVVK